MMAHDGHVQEPLQTPHGNNTRKDAKKITITWAYQHQSKKVQPRLTACRIYHKLVTCRHTCTGMRVPSHHSGVRCHSAQHPEDRPASGRSVGCKPRHICVPTAGAGLGARGPTRDISAQANTRQITVHQVCRTDCTPQPDARTAILTSRCISSSSSVCSPARGTCGKTEPTGMPKQQTTSASRPRKDRELPGPGRGEAATDTII